MSGAFPSSLINHAPQFGHCRAPFSWSHVIVKSSNSCGTSSAVRILALKGRPRMTVHVSSAITCRQWGHFASSWPCCSHVSTQFFMQLLHAECLHGLRACASGWISSQHTTHAIVLCGGMLKVSCNRCHLTLFMMRFLCSISSIVRIRRDVRARIKDASRAKKSCGQQGNGWLW